MKLRQRHPALKVELLTGDRLFDLVGEGIDVAIRLGRLADSNLQAVPIASFSNWLVAHPDLVPRKVPSDPRELVSLPFVALSVLQHSMTWKFEGPRKVARTVQFKAGIIANTAYVMHAMVLAGGGIAVIPDFAVIADVAAGRLVRLMPDWRLAGGGIHAVFPATRYRPEKVRALIQALIAHVSGSYSQSLSAG